MQTNFKFDKISFVFCRRCWWRQYNVARINYSDHRPDIYYAMIYYTGWLIPEHERQRLLQIFKPVYKDVYAHHITCQYDIPPDSELPTIRRGTIIGYADDREALECLVFSINGTTTRSDGETYHCTWSLVKGLRRPQDSKLVLKNGFLRFMHRMIIDIEPSIFETNG